jgi:hypothetical protein
VRYRAIPKAGSAGRRRFDKGFSVFLLALMVLGCLLFWGPIPAAGLWLASQVQYWTDSVSLGLLTGFASILAALFGGLVLLKRLDAAWILVRRAAGYDQRKGVLPVVFGVTAAVAGGLFMGWFILIEGPGSSLGPAGG